MASQEIVNRHNVYNESVLSEYQGDFMAGNSVHVHMCIYIWYSDLYITSRTVKKITQMYKILVALH